MSNYFRITAYHPTYNISAIFDSNGRFEKLWQFSAYLISKGFKVLEVGTEGTFDFGDMPKAEYNPDKIFLRACATETADITGTTITVNGKRYSVFR